MTAVHRPRAHGRAAGLGASLLALLALAGRASGQPVDAGADDPASPRNAPRADAPSDGNQSNRSDDPATPPGDEPPRVTVRYPPLYPEVAAAARRKVTIHVLVELDATGAVTGVKAAPSHGLVEFADLAEAAVVQWTFSPARRNGLPVRGSLDVAVVFDPTIAGGDGGETIEVRERLANQTEKLSRLDESGSDHHIGLAPWRAVPRASAADLLTLAPSVFLTKTGGSGDPEQIFLRGFDARDGQDVEMSLEGLPLNDVGNPHGHGLVDLHFLMPETVRSLRVEEGPYRAGQGDFAVSGSATFTLGLDDPGLQARYTLGSFASRRAFVAWRDETDPGTFVAASVADSNGYGKNRANKSAGAMARIAGGSDPDRDGTSWRAIVGAWASEFSNPGLLRAEDIDAGRIDRYGTYDRNQGGASSRAFVIAGVARRNGAHLYTADAFLQLRTFDSRLNYTGMLLDDRLPGESPHDQRGDLNESDYSGGMLGARAEASTDFALGPLHGAWTAGAYARMDQVAGTVWRLRALDAAPYRTELDAETTQINTAGYVSARLLDRDHRLTIQVGARFESVLYEITDHCAHKDGWFPGAVRDDVNCPRLDRYGIVLRETHRDAFGNGFAPRATATYDLVQWGQGGERGALGVTAGFGQGLRSLEASSLSQNETTPLGRIRSGDLGAMLRHRGLWGWLQLRASGFYTHVDNDLVFDEGSGKNVFAGETRRIGGLVSGVVQLGGLSLSSSATYTHATFGDGIPPTYQYYNSDRIPGKLVPYVPSLVTRLDGSFAWTPQAAVVVRHGLGVSYVGRRPLPQSERSAAVLTVDAATSARWHGIELGVSLENVLGLEYNSAEYNFSSWFPAVSGTAFPTRVPTRQVSPGAPRTVMLTLALFLEQLVPPHPASTPSRAEGDR